MGLLIFDDAGIIIEKIKVSAGTQKVGADDTASNAANGALGVDIPAGTWHTSFALAPDTVILEAKAGPYHPLTEAECAPWAPAEGAPSAAVQLVEWQALFAEN